MIIYIAVNGNWENWPVSYGACTATCGGGTQSKSRSCNNPLPSNGGLNCVLSDGTGNRGTIESQSQSCNSQACPGMSQFL